jgi:transcriptional regulator with PAS, ATPase and Fis domain
MLFSRSAKTRKLRMKSMEESHVNNRTVIEGKLKAANVVDEQLDSVLAETKALTTDIQHKLSTKLKITRNTIKTIVHSVKEAIVILDNKGTVIESNSAFEDAFTCSRRMIGLNFKEICKVLNPTTEDGKKYELTPDFNSLSQSIFDTKNFKTDIQPEIMLDVNPCHFDSFKCLFSLSILDNEPEHVSDISFILFFKCLKRATDLERRS